MKRLLILLGLALASTLAVAQGGSYTDVAAIQTTGNVVRSIPNARVVVCGFPATGGTPCTNLATTYSDPTLLSICGPSAQVVSPGTSTCAGTTDAAGNFSFFVSSGTYSYYFQASTGWKGPFTAVVGSTGSGGLGDPGGSGIVKRTTVNVTTPAVGADVLGLMSGTCNNTTFLRGDGSCQTPAGGGNVSTTPGGSQPIVQPLGTNFTVNNLANSRYAPAYNWSVSPAGTLTAATPATITLTPCPLGVNGTDANLGIYIAGTGTPEALYITGGSCTGGASSGTIQFTPANSHGAGFTIQSGTSGFREAFEDNGKNDQVIFFGPSPAGGGGVTNPVIMYTPAVIDLAGPVSVYCNNSVIETYGATNQNSAFMVTNVAQATFHECRGAANGNAAGAAVTNTACSSNVSTISSTLNPPVGTRVDVQFTFNTHFWGVHTVATTSGSSWTYVDNQCTGAISPGAGTIASAATAGNNAPIFAFIEDQNGFGVRYEDFSWSQPGSISGHLNNGLVIEGDQHAVITGNTGGGLGNCNSTYCGSWVYAPGPFNGSNPPQNDNAAVLYFSNNSMSLNCNWNGVTAYNGNTMNWSGGVLQGQAMWDIKTGNKRGGLATTTITQLYDEQGGCSNPIYAGSQGVEMYGQTIFMNAGEGPQGTMPTFGSGGSTTYYYWMVVHDTIGGVSAPLLVGTCTPSGTTCNVNVPRADDNGTVTYDFLRSTDQDNAPTTANCTGGSTTACGSVSLGVAQVSTLTITFTDSVASNTTSYSVSGNTYTPIFPFFPGSIVLQAAAVMDCLGLNVGSASCVDVSAINGYGPIFTDSPAFKTSPRYLEIFSFASHDVQQANAAGHANSALLLENTVASGQTYAAKGRLNFTSAGGGSIFPGTDIITLGDSNFPKTLAHMGFRPTLDNSDSGIGFDTAATGNPNTWGLHIASAVSISNYINTARDGSSWKERLTSTLKTFNVPVALTEQAAPSGSASKEVCYGDSSTHQLNCSYNNGSFFKIPQIIATGATALGTGGINSGTCAAAATGSATGTTTASVVHWSFATDPNGVTGYAGSATGAVLQVYAFPTSNTVNFRVCNNTSGTITPSAISVNWEVVQ